MAKRKIKLTIAYDGSEYHGWQYQPDTVTVQGIISEAITKLTGDFVRVVGASRTDAGVHALGQAACIKVDSPIPTRNFVKAVNDRLPEDIVIISAKEVEDDFDVTRDVKNKLYRYTIYNGKTRPVLQIKHCWFYPYELDVKKMNEAAKFFEGKKDFTSFASSGDQRDSKVRTVFRSRVFQKDNLLYYEVEGDGFLYNMVRNIVGTLVEVGRGKIKPGEIEEILKAKNRTKAGGIAPASGLCLMWLEY